MYRMWLFLLRECMKVAQQFVNVNVSAEAYEVLLLWFLFYIKLCGGTERINASENGAQLLMCKCVVSVSISVS